MYSAQWNTHAGGELKSRWPANVMGGLFRYSIGGLRLTLGAMIRTNEAVLFYQTRENEEPISTTLTKHTPKKKKKQLNENP